MKRTFDKYDRKAYRPLKNQMKILLIKSAGEFSCLIFCKKYSDHQSPHPLL